MTFTVALAQDKMDSNMVNHSDFSKKKISYSAGLFVSIDAEAFYVAPTIKAELRYQVTDKFSVIGFGHYFKARYKSATENGNFKLLSFGLLPQIHLGRKNSKGMYLGLGICHQSLTDKFNGDFVVIDDKRNYFTAAYALGYLFNSKKERVKFALELFATGPYSEGNAMSSYTEILTQVSLGGKVIF